MFTTSCKRFCSSFLIITHSKHHTKEWRKRQKWYKNGSQVATRNLSETQSNPYVFGTYASSSQAGEGSFNFGNPAFSISSGNSDANGYGNFEYSVPSGYYALCTKNLAQFG